MMRKRSAYILLIIGLLIGATAGYAATYVTYQSNISQLESDISELQSENSQLQVDNSQLQSELSALQTEIASLQSQLGRYEWLKQLIEDLQRDATDTNPYVEYIYEDEHYARDLEAGLEALGYDVTYLVVFGFTTPILQWNILVKVNADNYGVLVNPQTDAIVTLIYDGDGDGIVETIRNPTISDVSASMELFIQTKLGNDGQYLIFEFDDYAVVWLADTSVGTCRAHLEVDLEEDKTDQQEYVENTHDCDDFAADLEDALEAKGYRVTIKLVYWKDDEGFHGHCIVNVHCTDGTVTVEPQTDADVSSTYDGDGDGEVETASPGSVRAGIWISGFKACWSRWPTGPTDGDYLIFEYEDMDDVPFDLD